MEMDSTVLQALQVREFPSCKEAQSLYLDHGGNIEISTAGIPKIQTQAHAYSTLLYIQTLLELGDHGGTWLQIRKVQQA
jgi:hypothetical protein